MDPTLAMLLVDTLAERSPSDHPGRSATRRRRRSAAPTVLCHAARAVRRWAAPPARETTEPTVCTVS